MKLARMADSFGGLSGPGRGRGGSLERGRISRGRGGYTSYGRPAGYDSGWGNGEQSEWSPRKEYNPRTMSMDNWRRNRNIEDEDGWRSSSQSRAMHEKWGEFCANIIYFLTYFYLFYHSVVNYSQD